MRPERLVALLVLIQCGGVGLNLQCAARAYLMRPQWVPGIEHQAIGQLHRSGQTREVIVVRLIAVGTADEDVVKKELKKIEHMTNVRGR